MITPSYVKKAIFNLQKNNAELLCLAERCIENELLGSAIRILHAVNDEYLRSHIRQVCFSHERFSYAVNL